jgi:hypothetical protein
MISIKKQPFNSISHYQSSIEEKKLSANKVHKVQKVASSIESTQKYIFDISFKKIRLR